MYNILVCDDDKEIVEAIEIYLSQEGYHILKAYDGMQALKILETEDVHLLILDVMMPRLDGIHATLKIREKHSIPIIILSAKDTDSDKSLGLGLGADDYVTKPFSVTEVLARIKANIRRSTQYAAGAAREEQRITRGELVIDLNEFSVRKKGKKIELTAKEFEILKLLMQNPKKVYTKEQLYASVWKDAYLGDENAVNVHISRLRNKIEDNPRDPQYILTVWGIGYKLGETP